MAFRVICAQDVPDHATVARFRREHFADPAAVEDLFGQVLGLAAAAGLGVAFVSRWSVQREVAEGTLRILPIRDLHIVRAFAWATQARELNGAAGRFLAWARRNPPAAPSALVVASHQDCR